MDGEIDAPLAHRLVKIAGEEIGGALLDWRRQITVSGSLHGNDFVGRPGEFAREKLNRTPRLRQGEPTATSSDDKRSLHAPSFAQHFREPQTSSKRSRNASTSAAVWAAEMKLHSNCEGAM